MTRKFENKVALVTGAASGIGRGAAQVFARYGASVVVSTDTNIRGGEETVNLIKSAGGNAAFVKCDVSRENEVESLVKSCVDIYGRLDFAFNNAGIGPDVTRVPVVNIADCPEDIWDRTLDINLKGVFLCMKYEIRQMTKQGYGTIVNTSSVGALKPTPGFGAYAASKSGMISLTKAAALECATLGIRVNVILPGPTKNTQLFVNLTSSMPDEGEHMLDMIPMKRLATPEDMGEAVVWLCSDEASMITGHAMPVDGGMAST
jgi:NAD(P)-dependent dehydrogenase (short-subunit alcohol dehydrogenase family)